MVNNQNLKRTQQNNEIPNAALLVDTLKASGLLTDARLEAAFRAVPRHLFLPDTPLDEVYSDKAIVTKRDSRGRVISSSSQPTMMALMLAQLALRPGDNVLEIGSATGYNAAIMQQIVGATGKITTIELDKDLADQAQANLTRARMRSVAVVNADGAIGYSPRASYDRIISTVGIYDIPPTWIKQLKPDGVLVAPLWLNGQVSAAFTVQPDGSLLSTHNIPCSFIQIRGAAEGPNFFVPINGSGLVLVANDLDEIDSVATHLLLTHDFESGFLGTPLERKDMQHGFVLYLMLNTPPDYRFAHYFVEEGQKAYGVLTESGSALLTPGSAAMLPYDGGGSTFSFGGADAFLAMYALLNAWIAVGKPNMHNLRVHMLPKTLGKPEIRVGKLYERENHYLHVWLE